MEDVLDLYEEPYDPQYPTVCLDESQWCCMPMCSRPFPSSQASPNAWMTSTNAKAHATCL